jgi:hypothetical protein
MVLVVPWFGYILQFYLITHKNQLPELWIPGVISCGNLFWKIYGGERLSVSPTPFVSWEAT